MKFAEYYKRLTPSEKTELAKKLKTSKAYMSQLYTGHRQPGGKILKYIWEATDHNVSVLDFFPEKH